MFVNPINLGIQGEKLYPFRVNYNQEGLIEQIKTKDNATFLNRILFISIIVHVLTGNFISIIVILFFYFILRQTYHQSVVVSLTTQRMVINSQGYPIHHKIISGLILGVLILIDIILPFTYITIEDSYALFSDIARLFYLSGIFEFIFGFYLFVFTTFTFEIQFFGSLIGPLIYSVLFIDVISKKQNIVEISKQRIEEVTIKDFKRFSYYHIIPLLIIYTILSIILEVLNLRTLGFILLLIFIIIGLIFPRNKFKTLSLFSKNRRLVSLDLNYNPILEARLQKILYNIFKREELGSSSKNTQNINKFDAGADRFVTGIKAINEKALKQAIILGAVFYLFQFIQVAIFFGQSDQVLESSEVVGLIIYLVIFVLILLSLNFFVSKIVKSSKPETYIIGDTFEAFEKSNLLWILKKSVISGITLKKQFSRKLFRFDKITGFSIAWGLAVSLGIGLISLIYLSLWFRFGAINISGLILVFTFYFQQAVFAINNFTRIQTFLSIVFATFLWLLTLVIYPRLYILSRPKYSLDLIGGSKFTLTMKDEEDLYQSYSYGWNSTLSKKMQSIEESTRIPGFFIYEVTINDLKGLTVDKKISMIFGLEQRERIISYSNNIFNQSNILFNHYICSAKIGYPLIPIKIKLLTKNDELIATITDENILDGRKKGEKTIKIDNITLSLKLSLIKTQS
jgi:hypothetical protein